MTDKKEIPNNCETFCSRKPEKLGWCEKRRLRRKGHADGKKDYIFGRESNGISPFMHSKVAECNESMSRIFSDLQKELEPKNVRMKFLKNEMDRLRAELVKAEKALNAAETSIKPEIDLVRAGEEGLPDDIRKRRRIREYEQKLQVYRTKVSEIENQISNTEVETHILEAEMSERRESVKEECTLLYKSLCMRVELYYDAVLEKCYFASTMPNKAPEINFDPDSGEVSFPEFLNNKTQEEK